MQGLEEEEPTNACNMDDMVMAPEEDFVLIVVPNMGQQQQQAAQSKGEVKVGTIGGTSNPWKVTVNSQDPSSS